MVGLAIFACRCLGGAAPFDPLPDLDGCNVVWDSPSTNSSGSMPLGNGDIGVNAWVEENGDLVCFISKTDAWTDSGRLVKLGQVRVRLTPPLATQPFHQELQLRRGQMMIRSGAGGSATTLRLWIDANRPVIHIEGEAQQAMQAWVGLYVWRTADRDLKGDGTIGYLSEQNTGPILEKADTVVPQEDKRIVWCPLVSACNSSASVWLGEFAAVPRTLIHRLCFMSGDCVSSMTGHTSST